MNSTLDDALFFTRPAYGVLSQIYVQAIVVCLLGWSFYAYGYKDRFLSGVPIITASDEKLSAATAWYLEGSRMLRRGLEKYSSVFQVMTGTGPVVVLPNRFAEEIRNIDDLSFNRYFDKDFFVHYPGFEAYRTGYQDGTFIQEVVRTKLTQSLGLITKDLVEEMTLVADEVAGKDPNFHPVVLKSLVSDTVTRLSSRVFLGPDLAHNKRWLEIAAHYTHDSYSAAGELRQWPFFLRPFVIWFLPKCKVLRQEVRDANTLITPEVRKRQQNVRDALAAGKKPPKMSDTIGWMYEISRGRNINYVHGQLFLSFAAIHTTSETISTCLFDICAHPEVVDPLREEIISVISENGWAKTSLYKLKLLDSFMKESQRRNHMGLSSMHRHVDRKIQLSDGTVLPKGTRLMVAADPFMDPKVYPDPENFDLYRFYNIRAQPGQENSVQYVTTSPQYLLFGHGQHACPGRFFASNEMKIALCHFLLKYDWKVMEGENIGPIPVEQGWLANPVAKVLMRRRKEEIDIDNMIE